MRLPFSRRHLKNFGAAWLSDRLLLVIGDFGDASEVSEPEATARSAVVGPSETVLIVHFTRPGPPEQGLMIRSNGRAKRVRAAELAQATTDLKTLVRQRLAALDAATRQRLLDLVLEASHSELSRTGAYSLAGNLNLLRNALREPAPRRVRTVHDRQAVHVERLLAIDETSFWIRGWVTDRGNRAPQVELVSPEGHRVRALDGLQRHARPDIDQYYADVPAMTSGVETGAKHGFVGCFELSSPSLLSTGWLAELSDAGGPGVEVDLPAAATDLFSVRQGLMSDLKAFSSWQLDDELLSRHAHPAFTKLQKALQRDTTITTVRQFGTPAQSPDVSVVVPLYGRIDFMEHQLCQFMHDPDFREVDLIYVLDSPELGEQLEQYAAALHALYELPFRTVRLNRNAGYSIANNLGASVAHGRLLLLLNSDVLPDAPGWIKTLAAFYDATPQIGALGPKLLYEDGSLQHAGLYFEREAGAPLWMNLHYYKGLRGDFQPANIARPVPAVTGACLMVARSLWEEVGGLKPDFVQGGYEDSDFCLRLRATGCDNWYLPHVELHHLEDQSFPSDARRMATAYNAWLQTRLWGTEIQELMSDQRFSARPPVHTH